MGNSLMVQWLRLHASSAGDMSSMPGWGTKIPHATWPGQKKKILLMNNMENYLYSSHSKEKMFILLNLDILLSQSQFYSNLT